jgi:hypothetical protein
MLPDGVPNAIAGELYPAGVQGLHAERRQAYELLELRVRLSVEGSIKIAYAEWMRDARRLAAAPAHQDTGGTTGKGHVDALQSSSETAPDTSSTTPPRGNTGRSAARAQAGRA